MNMSVTITNIDMVAPRSLTRDGSGDDWYDFKAVVTGSVEILGGGGEVPFADLPASCRARIMWDRPLQSDRREPDDHSLRELLVRFTKERNHLGEPFDRDADYSSELEREIVVMCVKARPLIVGI